MKNQALSSLELPENDITYHMISIEKDTIAAITNSNSGVICSQGHYHKTCPSNSKLFHSFIIICETTYIKLRKKEDQLYQQQQQINHTTPTSLKHGTLLLTELPAEAKKKRSRYGQIASTIPGNVVAETNRNCHVSVSSSLTPSQLVSSGLLQRLLLDSCSAA
jgi:hypothetical protein